MPRKRRRNGLPQLQKEGCQVGVQRSIKARSQVPQARSEGLGAGLRRARPPTSLPLATVGVGMTAAVAAGVVARYHSLSSSHADAAALLTVTVTTRKQRKHSLAKRVGAAHSGNVDAGDGGGFSGSGVGGVGGV